MYSISSLLELWLLTEMLVMWMDSSWKAMVSEHTHCFSVCVMDGTSLSDGVEITWYFLSSAGLVLHEAVLLLLGLKAQ